MWCGSLGGTRMSTSGRATAEPSPRMAKAQRQSSQAAISPAKRNDSAKPIESEAV